MNAFTIVSLPLALMVLGGCALGPSASDSSATHSPLQVALQQLPVLDEQAPVLTETDLNFYSADPARIPVVDNDAALNVFLLEDALVQHRVPVSLDDEAVVSLSSRVARSPLAQCSQLCSFPMNTAQDIPSNLMQFSCDNDSMVRLREYPDSQDGQGFGLAREQVNVLVNGQPASLQRLRNGQQGLTLIAWRGSQHGYSLILPDSSDASARQALVYAEALP